MNKKKKQGLAPSLPLLIHFSFPNDSEEKKKKMTSLSSEKFENAIRRGDLATINQELDRCPGLIEDKGKYGTASLPLQIAAWCGQVEVCKLLIDHGANVNARSYDKWTALHSASMSGQLEAFKYLLTRGADVKAKCQYGYTPIRNRPDDSRFAAASEEHEAKFSDAVKMAVNEVASKFGAEFEPVRFRRAIVAGLVGRKREREATGEVDERKKKIDELLCEISALI